MYKIVVFNWHFKIETLQWTLKRTLEDWTCYSTIITLPSTHNFSSFTLTFSRSRSFFKSLALLPLKLIVIEPHFYLLIFFCQNWPKFFFSSTKNLTFLYSQLLLFFYNNLLGNMTCVVTILPNQTFTLIFSRSRSLFKSHSKFQAFDRLGKNYSTKWIAAIQRLCVDKQSAIEWEEPKSHDRSKGVQVNNKTNAKRGGHSFAVAFPFGRRRRTCRSTSWRITIGAGLFFLFSLQVGNFVE